MANDESKDGRVLDAIARQAERAVSENEQAIAKRTALTQRFLHEIEKEIAEAKRMLDALGQLWQRGDRTDYEFMRISLDKAMTARKKDRRDQLLREWNDLLTLREKALELEQRAAAFRLGKADQG